MSDKEKALQLHQSGLSYSQIAKALGIGKTTAYQFVKEAKQQQNNAGAAEVRSAIAFSGDAPPLESEVGRAEFTEAPLPEKHNEVYQVAPQPPTAKKRIFRDVPLYAQTERMSTEPSIQSLLGTGLPAIVSTKGPAYTPQPAIQKASESRNEKGGTQKLPANAPNPPAQAPPKPEVKKAPKLKEFTGDELIAKQFQSLPFTGKFLELIGKPSKVFAGIVWGLPKGGKSNFSIRFADYLQEYFGQVVYVAAEEGESVTLQEKFKEVGGSKVVVVEARDREEIRVYLAKKKCDFVFIDSINTAGIDNEFLELLKTESPDKSFIAIVQATKGGNFKGDQALTHNCDFIIKVVGGIAYHQGRFGVASEISIFEEPLYEKNPTPRTEVSKASSKEKGSGDGEPAKSTNDELSGEGAINDASAEESSKEEPENSEGNEASLLPPAVGSLPSSQQPASASIFTGKSLFGRIPLGNTGKEGKKSGSRTRHYLTKKKRSDFDFDWGTGLLMVGGALGFSAVGIYLGKEAAKKEQKKIAEEAQRRKLSEQRRALLSGANTPTQNQGQVSRLPQHGQMVSSGTQPQQRATQAQIQPQRGQMRQSHTAHGNRLIQQQPKPAYQAKQYSGYESSDDEEYYWLDGLDNIL